MTKYKRAKREDAKKESPKEMSIRIGTISDDFESLKTMCKNKSIELMNSLDLEPKEQMQVLFWTGALANSLGCRHSQRVKQV